MLIIYGKKKKLVFKGFVADLCPMCRKICSFRLNEVRMVGHLYYIAYGSGEPSGYEKECTICKSTFDADRSLYRPNLNPGMPLDKLEKQTFPNLREFYKDELELEQRINAGTLSPDDNISALCQIIATECYSYENFLAAGAFAPNDLKFGCLIPLATMFVSFFGIIIFENTFMASFFAGVLMLTGLGGFLVYIILRLTARRRFARSISLPRIAVGIRSIKPDLKEIKTAFARISGSAKTLLSYLSPELLLTELKKFPAQRK